MKKSGVTEWHKWFKKGHKIIEDDERIHPGSHRTNENSNKCLSIRAMAVQLSLDKESMENV
jgi:hypothetical protein